MASIMNIPYTIYSDDHASKHPNFIWHDIMSITSTDYNLKTHIVPTKKNLNTKCLHDLLTHSPKASDARNLSDITDLINKFVIDYNYTINGNDIIRCTYCSVFYDASYYASVSMTHFYDNVYEMLLDVNDYEYENSLNVKSKFNIIIINNRYYTLTKALYEWLNDSTKPKKLDVLKELIY
jgi:hypothetical protein